MMPEGGAALLRARRAALEAARRALAASLCVEGEAEAAARDAERAIDLEADAARALTADDGAVEAFAAWLPEARRRADVARAASATAQAETSRARAGRALALQARRAAERAAGDSGRQAARTSADAGETAGQGARD